jgi:hypothetical protein
MLHVLRVTTYTFFILLDSPFKMRVREILLDTPPPMLTLTCGLGGGGREGGGVTLTNYFNYINSDIS